MAACQHEDRLIHRFDLLHEPRHFELAELAASDIRSVSPEPEVRLHPLGFKDPWDFEEVFARLHEFARSFPFDTDKNDYLIHMTTGMPISTSSHVQQICFSLLAESRHLPGRLLQTSPPPRNDADAAE